MINYLQLGRNLRRFAPRVEAKTTTYIYNAKGIYDFKQLKPEINEALTNSFRGVENPVLELTVTKSASDHVDHTGVIKIKDGCKEVSADTFALNGVENAEDFLPETNGVIKKSTYTKEGIEKVGEQYELLGKFLSELTAGLKNPIMELMLKDKSSYSIGSMVLRDGEKEVIHGYFSRTKNNKVPIEKFHFSDGIKFITGYGLKKDMFSRISECLPEKMLKRLWLLDERSKDMVKTRYGVGTSPKTAEEIAKKWKLTSSRIRGILRNSLAKMRTANTYCPELKEDLDNLGHILTELERYKIYKTRSSIAINAAEAKIIRHNGMKLQ